MVGESERKRGQPLEWPEVEDEQRENRGEKMREKTMTTFLLLCKRLEIIL